MACKGAPWQPTDDVPEPRVLITAGRAEWRAVGTGLLGLIVTPLIFLIAVKLERLTGLRRQEAA